MLSSLIARSATTRRRVSARHALTKAGLAFAYLESEAQRRLSSSVGGSAKELSMRRGDCATGDRGGVAFAKYGVKRSSPVSERAHPSEGSTLNGPSASGTELSRGPGSSAAGRRSADPWLRLATSSGRVSCHRPPIGARARVVLLAPLQLPDTLLALHNGQRSARARRTPSQPTHTR